MAHFFVTRLRAAPSGLSDAALLFVITTLTFTLAGALWGWLYPTAQFEVTTNQGLEPVLGTSDAGFRAFVYFLAGTCSLSALLAAWAFRFLSRGIGQLIWLALCVTFGTWWFVFIGSHVVDALFPVYDANSTKVGDVLEIAHLITPWPGILLAPAVALVVYWIAAVAVTDADFDTFASPRKTSH